MTELESLEKKLERPGEGKLSALELANNTEIKGFEKAKLLDNEKVSKHLQELPPTHLENCPSIEYAPQHRLFQARPSVLAFFRRDTHEIKVGPEKRFGSAQDMLDTITHEVGHNVHTNMLERQPELADRWLELHEQSLRAFKQDGAGFVSRYARTNFREDFAETYKSYVHDPEHLRFMSAEKYEFMRREVFAGREYANRP